MPRNLYRLDTPRCCMCHLPLHGPYVTVLDDLAPHGDTVCAGCWITGVRVQMDRHQQESRRVAIDTSQSDTKDSPPRRKA